MKEDLIKIKKVVEYNKEIQKFCEGQDYIIKPYVKNGFGWLCLEIEKLYICTIKQIKSVKATEVNISTRVELLNLKGDVVRCKKYRYPVHNNIFLKNIIDLDVYFIVAKHTNLDLRGYFELDLI